MGRTRSEVGYLNGAVVRFGQQAGVPAPVNRLLTDTLERIVRGGSPRRVCRSAGEAAGPLAAVVRPLITDSQLPQRLLADEILPARLFRGDEQVGGEIIPTRFNPSSQTGM